MNYQKFHSVFPIFLFNSYSDSFKIKTYSINFFMLHNILLISTLSSNFFFVSTKSILFTAIFTTLMASIHKKSISWILAKSTFNRKKLNIKDNELRVWMRLCLSDKISSWSTSSLQDEIYWAEARILHQEPQCQDFYTFYPPPHLPKHAEHSERGKFVDYSQNSLGCDFFTP